VARAVRIDTRIPEALRLTVGGFTTEEEVDRAADALIARAKG
jgi:hypothetical protein